MPALVDVIIQQAPLLIVAGGLAGFLAGFFGVGGGLVVVPALYFLISSMGVPQEVAIAIAIATSLVSIIPTALSSLRAHHSLNNVDWLVVKRWALPMVAGVCFGALFIATLRTPWFIVAFGVLLLLVAFNRVFGDRLIKPLRSMPSLFVQACAAFLIGFVSVIAGVGGGATGVPTLVGFSLAVHRAVGTCAALGLCISVPGAVSVFLLSETPSAAPEGTFHLVYLPALFVLVPFSVLLAPVGARVGKRVSPSLLSQLFTAVLIIVGIRMLVSAF